MEHLYEMTKLDDGTSARTGAGVIRPDVETETDLIADWVRTGFCRRVLLQSPETGAPPLDPVIAPPAFPRHRIPFNIDLPLL